MNRATIKGAKVAIGTVVITEPKPLPPPEPINLTAPAGGFTLSEQQRLELNKLNADLHRREANFRALNPSPAGRPEAGTNSLVKECKSPTRDRKHAEKGRKESRISMFLQHLRLNRPEAYQQTTAALGVPERHPKRVVVGESALHSDSIGSFGGVDIETGEVTGPNYYRSPVARISYRSWADEYRIRVQVDTNPSEPPPQQGGDRVTKTLSNRGARNVLESGAYVAAVRGGFTTFLTLTFAPAARARIVNGESTIGSEAARFFDAMQKMYQRGWCADHCVIESRNGFDCVANSEQVVQGKDDKLDYIWVAEAPKNAEGEVNPHCHVLMRWEVEPHLFRAWAKRIEALWGQGFAKLERIRSAQAASGYLLKALGYLTKGSQNKDQGEIKGNRYNISKTARAPGWECLGSFHAEHMAAIIGEVKEKLQRRAAPIKGELAAVNTEIDKAIRDKAVLKRIDQDRAAKVAERLKALEARAKELAAQIKGTAVRAADYQITFKGPELLAKFLDWSAGARFWNGIPRETHYIPNKFESKRWARGIKAARAKYRYLLPRLEEKAALWCQVLREEWRAMLPEKRPEPGLYQEYENWISTTC